MSKHTDKLHLDENEENNALFSAILHITHDAVIAIDQSQNIILFNQGAKEIFGYNTSSEVIGQPLDILLPKALSKVHRDHIRNFENTESITRMMGERREVFGRRKDGTIFPAEASIAKVTNGSQTIFSVILRDATERELVKEVLEKSKNIFSKAFHNSPMPLMITRQADSTYIDVNDSFLRLLEYRREEVIGKTGRELGIVNSESTDLVQLRRQLSEQGRVINIEIHGKSKSGRIITALASAENVEINGEACAITTMLDITDRRRAEEIRVQSEQRMRLATKAAEIGVWELNLKTNEVLWDPILFDIYGLPYRADHMMNYSDYVEAMLPEDMVIQDEIIEKLKAGQPVPKSREFRIRRKNDGAVRILQAYDLLVRNENGEPEWIIGTNQDITERRHVETENLRRLQNIQALQRIDQAIAGSMDLKLTLNVLLEQTKTELKVDAAAVLLFNPYIQALEFAAGIGFYSKAIEQSHLRLGEGHGGRAALERKTVSIVNLLEDNNQFVRAALLADEGFVTYFGTPLIAKGQVRGVLEVFHRSMFIPDQDWLDFLEVLAGQSAIAVDSASLFTDLQDSNTELFNAYDSTIEGWSRALDLRDKETEGHTQRVTELTLKLARAARIPEKELTHVRHGALLHDIGKMGVPDAILLKPDKLTDEEWIIMRKHPVFAFELLMPIAYLRPALDIPYCHHEKWDGSGYPRGLKGEQIPLVARLFSVIDVWDALRSDRPYRQGWSKERTSEHIKSLSGTHFDPKAVELFLTMMSEDEKNAG